MGFLRKAGNFLTFGAIDRSEAKKITKNANDDSDEIRHELEAAREKTNSDIVGLGLLKEETYKTVLTQFVEHYSVIGKVDLKALKDNDFLDYDSFQTEMKQIVTISTNMKSIATTVAGSALVGGTAAVGTMGAVALLATASTGTAIGSLSGAAAANATLAWLGGGTLATGGAGMAGGMAVLAGIALAPVAIVGMFLGANHGKRSLNDAENYQDEVRVLVEKVKTLIDELSQIRRGCEIMCDSIKGLSLLMQIYNSQMAMIGERLNNRNPFVKHIVDPVKSKVFNLSVLTDQEVKVFQRAANVGYMLSGIIKKPLMDEEGAFMSTSLQEMIDMQPDIKKLMPNDLKRIEGAL